MDMQIFAASVGTRLCNGDNMGAALRSAALDHDAECAVVKARTDGVYSATRAGYFDVEPMEKREAMKLVFSTHDNIARKAKLTLFDNPEAFRMLGEYMDRPNTWRARLGERVYDIIAGK